MTKDCSLIDQGLLDLTSREARESPRRRRNHNFHEADDAVCHRLLNAMEPGSYVRPHRHLEAAKDETLVVLRGCFGLVLFDADGVVTRTVRLEAGGATFGVTIPYGTFHTLLALAEGSVFFEAKAGPYRPLAGPELAPWAPEEKAAEAAAWLRALEERFAALDG